MRVRVVSAAVVASFLGCGARTVPRDAERAVADAASEATAVADAPPEDAADVAPPPVEDVGVMQDAAPVTCSPGDPVVVLVPDVHAYAIAVDEHEVHYVSTIPRGHSRVLKSGGTPTLLSVATPFAIALSPTYVYFTMSEFGTVGRVLEVGGTGEALLEDQPIPRGIAWADGRAFFGIERADTSEIFRFDEPSHTVSSLAKFVGQPLEVAVAAGDVYWSTGAAGAVAAAPVDGGAQRVVLGGELEIRAFATDGHDVFATSFGRDRMGRLVRATSDASVTVYATALTDPRGVVLDEAHVYWVDGIDDTVERIGRDRGDRTVVARLPGHPLALADDATCLYVATSKGIVRVAK